MQIFICECCDKKLPTIHKNTHHKIPKSLGGKDTQDNLIDICPNCHDALHAIAHRMMSKKASSTQIIDSIALIYPGNDKAQRMCLELATWVRNAMIGAKENGMDPNHLITIGTTLRNYYKPLIQNRYRELNTTQEAYIRGLILADLAKRFNLKINHIEEKIIMENIKKQKSILIN